MKIAVAQTRPVKGDIPHNIARHAGIINLALANGAGMIIFPELSLTGYEPTLAKALAIDTDDTRLAVFQEAGNQHAITIGVGVPTRHHQGVCISMVLFQPGQPRRSYSKMYLHSDETSFFVAGPRDAGLIGAENDIALAICYELSVPEHAAMAFKNGAHMYMASVAKTAAGVAKAADRLSVVAREYGMTVFMANSLGVQDNFHSAGQSAVWSRNGELLAQMDEESEGIIIHDSQTQKTSILLC